MQELTGKRNIRTANATLKGGRRRAALSIAWVRVTCFSREVLQLFMTDIVGLFYNLSFLGLRDITFSMRVNST